MLPRIRERIANEVRQQGGGGGNPFQLNFNNNDNNNNGNGNGRQQQQAAAGRNLAAAAAPNNRNANANNMNQGETNRNNQQQQQQQQQQPLVRPEDLFLGCSTRVRRELLRVNEWDRMIALKDVWTKQVVEAPTREDLQEQQQNGNEDGGNNNNNNNNANNNNNNGRVGDPAVWQVLGLPNPNNNGDANNNNDNNNQNQNQINENTNHDIREIMDHNIKKQRFRPAFYKVQFFNPTYTSNLELMKLFYKRHANNPKLAAQQFCRYWDLKLAYFGLEQLCKPLSLKHSLSSQDKACLHNGCMQLSRDDYGRTVLYLLPDLVTVEQANGSTTNTSNGNMDVDDQNNALDDDDESTKLVCPHLVRALWYLVFRALQDSNSGGAETNNNNNNNLVILLLGQDKDDLFGKTILHCTSVLREALPFHVVALHYMDGPGMTTLDEDDSNNNNNSSNNASNRTMNHFHHHHHDNFLWQQQQQQQNNQDVDMHGFGGLEQVAEWGGAVVQVPEPENDPQQQQHDQVLLPGAQDAQQQRRMLEKSKASLEHLEDRVGRNVRLRLRFHNLFQLQLEALAAAAGNDDDEDNNQDKDEEDPFGVLRKRLVQFGIPNLPLNSDGTLIMHNPIDASSKRFFFTKAEHALSSNLILPTSKDILLGKGRPYQEHPGNIALNDVIDKHRSDYTSFKSRSEKTAMSQSILETIQSQGGRFLIKKSKDDDLWVVAAPAKARDKIAHSFRLPRKHLKEAMDKAKQQKQKEQEEKAAQTAAAAAAASGGGASGSETLNNPLSQQQQQQQQAPLESGFTNV